MKKISKILLALLLTSVVSNAMAAEPLKGDVNGDHAVNVADLTALVNIILNETTANDACDVNGDHTVNIMDVIALVNIILGNAPAPGSDNVDIDDDPAWEPANAPRRRGDDFQTIRQQTPTDKLDKTVQH